jgi:hypothetical protein
MLPVAIEPLPERPVARVSCELAEELALGAPVA